MPNGLSPYEPYRPSSSIQEWIDDLPPTHKHIPRLRTRLAQAKITESLMEAPVLLLRHLKTEKDVSVRKLAQMAGCSPASVSNDLAGRGDLARVLHHILNLGGSWNLTALHPDLTYGKSASAINPNAIMVTSHPIPHASPTSSSSSSNPTSTASAPDSEQTDSPTTPTSSGT
jgi:hypothetical protein